MLEKYYEVVVNCWEDDWSNNATVSSDLELEKGDTVVFPYQNSYVCGTVVRVLNSLQVLSFGYHVEEVICKVDTQKHEQAKEKELARGYLLKMMKKKEEELKLENSLKKLATSDDDFAKYYELYKATFDSGKSPDLNEVGETIEEE